MWYGRHRHKIIRAYSLFRRRKGGNFPSSKVFFQTVKKRIYRRVKYAWKIFGMPLRCFVRFPSPTLFLSQKHCLLSVFRLKAAVDRLSYYETYWHQTAEISYCRHRKHTCRCRYNVFVIQSGTLLLLGILPLQLYCRRHYQLFFE